MIFVNVAIIYTLQKWKFQHWLTTAFCNWQLLALSLQTLKQVLIFNHMSSLIEAFGGLELTYIYIAAALTKYSYLLNKTCQLLEKKNIIAHSDWVMSFGSILSELIIKPNGPILSLLFIKGKVLLLFVRSCTEINGIVHEVRHCSPKYGFSGPNETQRITLCPTWVKFYFMVLQRWSTHDFHNKVILSEERNKVSDHPYSAGSYGMF